MNGNFKFFGDENKTERVSLENYDAAVISASQSESELVGLVQNMAEDQRTYDIFAGKADMMQNVISLEETLFADGVNAQAATLAAGLTSSINSMIGLPSSEVPSLESAESNPELIGKPAVEGLKETYEKVIAKLKEIWAKIKKQAQKLYVKILNILNTTEKSAGKFLETFKEDAKLKSDAKIEDKDIKSFAKTMGASLIVDADVAKSVAKVQAHFGKVKNLEDASLTSVDNVFAKSEETKPEELETGVVYAVRGAMASVLYKTKEVKDGDTVTTPALSKNVKVEIKEKDLIDAAGKEILDAATIIAMATAAKELAGDIKDFNKVVETKSKETDTAVSDFEKKAKDAKEEDKAALDVERKALNAQVAVANPVMIESMLAYNSVCKSFLAGARQMAGFYESK